MRPKISVTAIAALVFFIAFTVFITWRAKKLDLSRRNLDEATEISPLTGKVAPSFSLPAIGGRSISLAEYRGKKKIVVSFWASWCEPCRLETPALKEFYEQHREDLENFELLAVAMDSDRAAAEGYARSSGMPFPVLLDLQNETADAYGVTAIPTVFVIDERGKVIYGRTGYDSSIGMRLVQQLGLHR